MTTAPGPSRELVEEHLRKLEHLVECLALELTAAQDDGVSHALIVPRLMVAFRRSFGEPPSGFVLPGATS